MPDIAKVSAADAGKKAKVEERGVVSLKGGAGKKGDEEFNDFSFKEGTTQVLKMQDIYKQEKGAEALKKRSDRGESASAPRVGGAKGKKKAAAKAKGKKSTSAGAPAGQVQTSVEKVMSYTPSKGKRTTPQKGKVSTKKTISAKKHTPTIPSPGGKKSKTKTNDNMTMAQFKQYLDWHEKKKGGKASSGGKVLGKRSAASGKSTARGGKKSKK